MVVFSTQVLTALLAVGVALAMPAEEKRQNAACTSPLVRKSWHTLTDAEKKSYIDAELCLMKKPSTSGLRGARTRFDDFQVAHAFKTEIAHFVGQFLPLHRHFVFAHEEALRKECGYAGAQPYWDEGLDAGTFSKSIILDPVLGFGGNGAGPNKCIQNGPFANYTNSLGPGYLVRDHCIDRDIADSFSWSAAPAQVNKCLNSATTYLAFWPCIEMGPHGAGHGGIGAQMINPVSSPGDPIFFLHHAWLDWLWAKWQSKDKARLTDISGNNRGVLGGVFGGPSSPAFGAPGQPMPNMPGFTPINLTRPNDVPQPLVIGDPGNTTTLSQVLYLYGMTANRTIGEVMDTKGVLCYQYDTY